MCVADVSTHIDVTEMDCMRSVPSKYGICTIRSTYITRALG